MELHEIPISDWTAFFDQFSRLHSGQAADVETTLAEDGIEPQARAVTLLGVSAEPQPDEAPRIDIAAGDASGNYLRHAIQRPTRVRVAEWNDAVSALLEIESKDGWKTRVQVGPIEQLLPPGFITDGV